MSVFTLLPAIKVESINLMWVPWQENGKTMLTRCRLIAGFLMFVVGTLYIVFEKSILRDSESAKGALASEGLDGLSRTILGAQV